MPYKRVPPVDEKMMLDDTYLGHFSICQKLRDIYQMADKINCYSYETAEEVDTIKLNCRIAMAMAKNMQNKLKKYKDATNESLHI